MSDNRQERRRDEDSQGGIKSGEVAPTRLEIRCDDALKAAAKAEAETIGEDLSQFVRGCIRLRLAQIATVRAIQAGVDPEALLDPERFMAALAEVAKRQAGP